MLHVDVKEFAMSHVQSCHGCGFKSQGTHTRNHIYSLNAQQVVSVYMKQKYF